MKYPTEVARSDLARACEAFCEALDIEPASLYFPLHITEGSIELTAVVTDDDGALVTAGAPFPAAATLAVPLKIKVGG